MNKQKTNQHTMNRKEYIDFLANSTNTISMSNRNSKTGIAILNIAFPTCVCRADAPCKKLCYAGKGAQRIAKVQGAYYRNLRLYNENTDNFFEQMYYQIKFSGLSKVRLFDSGDFPDETFLYKLVELCNKTPNVKYMAFTKKYELINNYISQTGPLPENLNILFSAWDRLWKVPNPFNLGVAYIDFADKRLNPEIPDNAFVCPGRKTTCSACGVCWNKNLKALVLEQH